MRVQISTLVRPDFHARAAQRSTTASAHTRGTPATLSLRSELYRVPQIIPAQAHDLAVIKQRKPRLALTLIKLRLRKLTLLRRFLAFNESVELPDNQSVAHTHK